MDQLVVNNEVDFKMSAVKELIVQFSVASIQDISREGAVKAFVKIGLAKTFTPEFQAIAELRRDILTRTSEIQVIDEAIVDDMTEAVPVPGIFFSHPFPILFPSFSYSEFL